MKLILPLFAVIATSLLLIAPASAQQRRGQPPQEAFDACEGLDAGDACTVETPRGDTVEGTCHSRQQEGELFCRPNNRERRRNRNRRGRGQR